MHRSRSLSLLAAAAAAIALATPGGTRAETLREDFRVAGADGMELFVREVRADGGGGGKGGDGEDDGVPVILIHGARVPGLASFDLAVDGGSLAADLARRGHRVFVMDVRGYGGSTRPAAMDRPPAGPPLVPSHEVVRDIGAVAGWVRARTGRDRVALLGWATGGHWAGMYASLHPEAVSHLVIYNALYGAPAGHPTLGPGSELADPADPTRFNAGRFGAYRLNTAASLLPAWDRSIPLEDKVLWRDPAVAAAYVQAALASDPAARDRDPPAFRAPSGAMQDSFYLASGRQLWDASSITARVLVLRAARDFWSRPQDLTALQAHLVRAESVRAVTIPDATHHVHLDRADRGRGQFLQEVTAFLAE